MMRPFATAIAFIITSLLAAPSIAAAGNVVRIAVLDPYEDQSTIERWTPTAEYLTGRIVGYRFAVLALTREEIQAGLEREDLDFVLLDAGHYIELEEAYDLVPITTRRMSIDGQTRPRFGAVILVRADRDDIHTLADLKGQSFMAEQNSFGGFHLVWRELNNDAIYPFQDFARVALEAVSPEAIVQAVQQRKVDAGVIPTGVLERLAHEGRIDRQDFRVLNAQGPTSDFPFVRSTPLYPEWPLAASKRVSEDLALRVAEALHDMTTDDPAARAAGYAGWSPPLSYEPVRALHRDLGIGAYRNGPLRAFVRDNWPAVLGGTITLLALILLALHVLRVNRKLGDEIRRRARAQEQMQMFASAVEQTADVVMITDANGIIEYVNPAFSRVTGYTADEARGQTPVLLKSGQHDPAFYSRLWDTILRGEVYADEIINRRKDGSLFWEHQSITPLRDGHDRITHFIATGRDITEQRRSEEESQLRREQLAHTARVNVIGEMAASLAHEISQPLTAIINYSQGSIRRVRSADMDRTKLLGVLEQIVAQAQRAADALVTLRRFVARRKPQRVHADINSLVRQVAALAAGETRKRGISIVLDLSANLPPVTVDDVQIEQVILNLLRNGAEALASADGSARELRVRTTLTEDGNIEVSISDTGPGLPPRLAAKLFEPFFTTKPDGVGLGLAISRTIIETHGGRIWVTPNPERGVTFRFTVPVETQTHDR